MRQTTYKLRMPDEIAHLIRTMHPHLKKKIKSSLQIILSTPHSGKALKDELGGLRSFRVSSFRIIYKVSDAKEIEIVAIGSRNKIYEETLKLIEKGRD